MKKTIEYSRRDFDTGVDTIVNNILAVSHHTPYHTIVGISRGGLMLATRLSYKLDIPLTPVQWSSDPEQERVSLAWMGEEINEGKNILLVDDIIDSGNTIQSLIDDWQESTVDETLDRNNLSIACCYLNTDQDIMPDFWHKTIERSKDKRWIDFWWEQ